MSAPDPIELTGGRWVTRPGGLRVWEPGDRAHIGAKRQPESYFWDTLTTRRAHAAYFRGERDAWTREGERVYQRNRKRRQRERDRTCPQNPVEYDLAVTGERVFDDAMRNEEVA